MVGASHPAGDERSPHQLGAGERLVGLARRDLDQLVNAAETLGVEPATFWSETQNGRETARSSGHTPGREHTSGEAGRVRQDWVIARGGSLPTADVCRQALRARPLRAGRARRPTRGVSAGRIASAQVLVEARRLACSSLEGLAIGCQRSLLASSARRRHAPGGLRVDVEQHRQVGLERRAHALERTLPPPSAITVPASACSSSRQTSCSSAALKEASPRARTPRLRNGRAVFEQTVAVERPHA